MSEFDWLIFDADGTLFDYEAAEFQALSLSLRAFSLPDTKDSHELYRRFNAALWQLFEQNQISSTKLRLRRFEELLDALDAQVDPVALSARYLEELGGLAPLLPGAQELIEELAPQYGLALATNGIGQVQRRRIAISGLEAFFSAIVISDEIGVAKPSPEYFEILFQHTGNPNPDRVIMVGDSLSSDIKGGQGAGIFTCWFNPSCTPNTTEIRPDVEISELREVHRIVREPRSKPQPS